MSKTEPEKPRPRALSLLGRNLRRHRERAGLSLDDLARLARVPMKRLITLEEGCGDIHVDGLDRLASALAIPLQDLFFERDD